ncbi:MAG: SPOR domain-containing protein [Candidatus Endonucleobacter bathymodioli]|uniref:SPOR domain-containing protein n=1 Tax=Candidatus Endonucleibacter bathymodioli TaxID=539814 RepID=A0AA90NTE4_9GAMM|nr:SPOR domain-containing protein [Candidatus Endonucleobacter bathymodioli]
MGRELKQRLLGAVVLVLCLVMLAPALFRGGKNHPVIVDNLAAPEKSPDVPEFVRVLDSIPEVMNVDANATLVEDEKGQAGLDDAGHLKAWSLQLASFFDETNADKLQDTLREKGYRAYIGKVAHKSGRDLYCVYIGPEVHVKGLKELKRVLGKEMKLFGVIVRFEP